jgi:multidrug efflux pump subunit AcrB
MNRHRLDRFLPRAALSVLTTCAIVALGPALSSCKRKPATASSTGSSKVAAEQHTDCGDRLTIEIRYPGASPAEVEDSLVSPLEAAVRTVKGVRNVEGAAHEGLAQLIIEPSSDVDLQNFRGDVVKALDRLSSLPQDTERPVVFTSPGQRRYVVVVAHGRMPLDALRTWTQQVRQRLLEQPNIYNLSMVGAPHREMTIRADPARLRHFGLSATDVAVSVRRSLLPRASEPLLRVNKAPTLAELGELELSPSAKGQPIRLRDVVQLEDGFARLPRARVGGDPAVLLLIPSPPDVSDNELSKQVGKVIASTGHPDGKLFSTQPITVSNCFAGSAIVSGSIAILNVEEDAGTVRIPSGDIPPTVVLEGASLVGQTEPTETQTQLIGFVNHPDKATGLIHSWQTQIPGISPSSSVVAPQPLAVTVLLEHADLAVLDRSAAHLVTAARANNDVLSTHRYPSSGRPQLSFKLDREAVAKYGVTPHDVAKLVRTWMYGETVTRFADGRDEVPVILRVGPEHRSGSRPSVEQIRELTLTTPSGAVVPLDQLGTVTQEAGPTWILRHNGRRRYVVRIVVDSAKAQRSVNKALRATILAKLEASAPGLKVIVCDSSPTDEMCR